jgi:phosphopantetheine adenylyltransferase
MDDYQFDRRLKVIESLMRAKTKCGAAYVVPIHDATGKMLKKSAVACGMLIVHSLAWASQLSNW